MGRQGCTVGIEFVAKFMPRSDKTLLIRAMWQHLGVVLLMGKVR